MHPAFASVFLRECPRVCGLQLIPLQLGHVALLEAVSSPLMVGGDVSPADVAAMAWACSRPASEAIRGRKWWHVVRRPRAGDDQRLAEYLTFHLQAPRRWAEAGAQGPAVPWQWIYAARLCGGDWSKLGQVWNTPMLEATARCYTEDAMAGDKSIRSEAVELQIIEARKQAANG